MIKKLLLSFIITATVTLALKIQDPRELEFPTRLEFTPHEVQRYNLSNGIEVFLVADHEVPVVDITFRIQAGERRVPAGQAGLAKLTADLIVEGGSRTVPKRVFEDSLEMFGATFSGGAYTEEAYFSLCMLTENTPDLLPLVVQSIRYPALPEDVFNLNKRQYQTYYAARNSEPSSVARRIFYKMLYGVESPSAREVAPVTLEAIDLDLIFRFHQANYRPSNIMIGVAGDFEPEEMIACLEDALGDWQEPDVEAWQASPFFIDPMPPGVYVVHWPGSIQSNVRIGHTGIIRNDPEYAASRLFTEIYGGSWFSRLSDEIREERGLAYAVSGNLSSGFEEPGIFSAVALTKSESTIEALSIMIDEMEDIKVNGVTTEELDMAKQSWLASFPAHYAEPEQVMWDRMNYAAHDYPLDFWDKMPDQVEPLTLADVNHFAAGFLEPSKLVVFVLGDTTAFDGALSQFGDVIVIDPEEY